MQLAHVSKETSWQDTDEHGYVSLKSASGDELLRKGGFQHNMNLRKAARTDPNPSATAKW